ncbi:MULTISPECIES: Rrf2 family transcriptional regulator [Snodgrassella]|uniref:Fe-S cluster assembly transcriptional regulator IscR n=1 Tax=Snodgrassella alvi TaxID=1196083 RepID=A0A2N9X4Y0_9NEIS|nr:MULTISPECIES: Rrf2 family transcriptional regulator [Snodgrassella]MCX8746465.1 Rrf2 family transcriptional regulator [Snodgrassella sp. B3800]MCX8749269.1 Rrf2 family transcriptional regulator [Snodgrassella sp. B3088]MCX8753916.1 Rrf2 family transcriptional regulator [Snodgrassella sp. B3837]PIT38233.1 Fe-S cluster assembly transcriptional regulator IscR [Snodgrassella alvi]PIT40937.1 Fe-S cluster assembly transcriptional regulator IscR [Snodgrassella alvi]
MRLTTKGRFAVIAMLDLAMHAQSGAVNLTAISERQRISLSYLEQLFGKLRRAGLVESIRGPGGGYVLSHAADHINIADIIAAAEDTMDATLCGGHADCQDGTPCLTHDLWVNLNKTIDDYLRGITLQCILNQQSYRNISNEQKSSLEQPITLINLH